MTSIRILVDGFGRCRVPARLAGRDVIAACGPVSTAVPVFVVVPHRASDELREEAEDLLHLLWRLGYERAEIMVERA